MENNKIQSIQCEQACEHQILDSCDFVEDSTEEGRISKISVPSMKISQNALVNNKGNIRKEDLCLLSDGHRVSRGKNFTMNQLHSSAFCNAEDICIEKEDNKFLCPPQRKNIKFSSSKQANGRFNNANNSFKIQKDKLQYESTKKAKLSVNGLNDCDFGILNDCQENRAKQKAKCPDEKRKKRKRARTSNKNQIKGLSKKTIKLNKKHIVFEESNMNIALVTERKSSRQGKFIHDEEIFILIFRELK